MVYNVERYTAENIYYVTEPDTEKMDKIRIVIGEEGMVSLYSVCA